MWVNFNYCTNKSLILTFALGFLISFVSVLSLHNLGIDLSFWGESGCYTEYARKFFLHYIDESGPRSMLLRMPGYPLFIAFIYKVFGDLNHLAVAIAQCILMGFTALGVALSAKALKKEWALPAGLLACITPNLVLRATTIMPETFFAFNVIWALCPLLWIFNDKVLKSKTQEKITFMLLCCAGFFFGCAILTRTSFFGVPCLAFPALFFCLWRKAKFNFKKSLFLTLIPVFIMFVFLIPRYYQGYKETGHFMLTVETGVNFAYWMYPCLSVGYGCGERGLEELARAERLVTKQLSQLSESDLKNEYTVDRLKKEIGIQLIKEVPLTQLAKAYIGAQLKLLLHTSFYWVLDVWQIPHKQIFPKMIPGKGFNYLKNYFTTALENPIIFIWFLFQLCLFSLRGIQLLGVYRGLKSPYYAQTLLITSFAAALSAIALGFGNFRYRVPLEPMLALLTIIGGYDFVRSLVRKYKHVSKA